ncbi:MAG: YIP1 family protein [Paenisporosarcina sp.]
MNTEFSKPSLMGIFNKPNKQFEAIKNNPFISSPLLIVIFLYTIGMICIGLFYGDAIFKNEDEIPSDKVLAKMYFIFGVIISALFLEPIRILFKSLIVLASAGICHSNVTFRKIFSLMIHLEIIGIFILFIQTIDKIFLNTESFQWLILTGLLILTIWKMILFANGLKIVADFSKRFAWSVTIFFFVWSVIFYLISQFAK